MKPRLLDLFCGAGGATRGYQLAGFDVWGVDINPQPNYCGTVLFEVDALSFLNTYPLDGFAVIHASPPCQAYSVTSSLHANDHPEMVEPVRRILDAIGLPYVIENVVGAPLIPDRTVQLCGSSFGLGVRRHRLFETNPPILMRPPCSHGMQPAPVDVTGTGGPTSKVRSGGGGMHRKPTSLAHAREVMGIDWMTRRELSQAIPPAYTEWIGRQMLDHMEAAA